MNTVVFLGPSLAPETAARRLRAEFAPPARRGDLTAAVEGGARRIALIDGEFGQSLAVTVMEIRRALERGVEVWGASSMGALRAAECQALGMRGTGWVYEQYASGAIEADDEVALLFDPQSGRARTIPLVNLRWTAGRVTPEMADEVVRVGGSVHFAERSRAALEEAARGTAAEEAMAQVLARLVEDPERCDRKRMDAELLLDRLAGR